MLLFNNISSSRIVCLETSVGILQNTVFSTISVGISFISMMSFWAWPGHSSLMFGRIWALLVKSRVEISTESWYPGY